MTTGQILKILATDQGAEHDLPMFAKQTGNELIFTETDDEVYIFYLRRR